MAPCKTQSPIIRRAALTVNIQLHSGLLGSWVQISPFFQTLFQVHKKKKLKCIGTSKSNPTCFDIKQALQLFLSLKDQSYLPLWIVFFICHIWSLWPNFKNLPPYTEGMVTRESCSSCIHSLLAALVTHSHVMVSHSWGSTNCLWLGTTCPWTEINHLPYDVSLSPVSGGLSMNYLSGAPLPSSSTSGL